MHYTRSLSILEHSLLGAGYERRHPGEWRSAHTLARYADGSNSLLLHDNDFIYYP